MNSKKWKKELQEEVQPEELIWFIQKNYVRKLTPHIVLGITQTILY